MFLEGGGVSEPTMSLQTMSLQETKILWLLLVGLFFGCGDTEPAVAPDTLRVGLEDRPKTLDPRFATDVYGQRISRQLLFSSLVQHGEQLEIVPDLAASWEASGPSSYLFHLRRDFTFHDGTGVTAGDVVATFEHLMDPATGSPLGATFREKIAGLEAVGSHIVRVEQTGPSGSFLDTLISPILPGHLIAQGHDFAAQPIGSGPYRFDHQDPNRIVLTGHAGYPGGGPHMPRLVFEITRDDNVRFLKLFKGELDLLINALPEHKLADIGRPPLAGSYRLIESPGASFNYLGINVDHPALGVVDVRRAIALGIDREAVIEHRLRGHAVAATSLLAPINQFHHPGLPAHRHDPGRAMELLDGAGFPDPDGDGPLPRLSLELKVSTSSQALGHAQVFQAQLAEIGIELKVRSYEWGTFYGDIQAGNFQLCSMRWVGVTDPDFFYDILHSSRFPPAGRNRGRFHHAGLDRLLEAGRHTTDYQQRRAIYLEAQELIAEELPFIPLWHPNNVSVVHRRISGYRPHPKGGFYSFRDIQPSRLKAREP